MTSIARKTTAAENTRVDRIRNASAMMLAFTGQLDERRHLDASDTMHAELDLLSAWDIEDTNGDS